MNIEKQLQDLNVNFDGKIAIYYDDLKGNVIKINEKEKYNAASCIKIFILIELFNEKITSEIINIIKNQKYHEMVGDGIDNIYKKVNIPIVNYIVTKSGKYVYSQGRKISNLIFNEYLKLGAKNERSKTIGK